MYYILKSMTLLGKEGNFVVGNYDPKADAVILKKYKINRPTR